MNWFDRKVLILGLSKSGMAAAKYLSRKGADVYITEIREEKPEDKEKLEELKACDIHVEMGHHSDEFLSDLYLAVTSPGIPPKSEIFEKLRERKVQIISEVELAYQETGKPFVAITGTNGKTTTTTLVSHILGKKYNAPACGNIGVPPCEFLFDEDLDYFVCEMSSFQIETSSSFQAQIACWLTFTPDHLDWHGGLENYFNAKAKIFLPPQEPAFGVINGADEKLLEFSKKVKNCFLFDKEVEDNCCYIKNEKIYLKRRKVEEEIISLADCPLVGQHNYQNIMCSIIVAKLVGIENEVIVDAIKEFKAPEHRLEYVTEINGIEFYNDSKATNPEASIVAIKSFNNGNTVLIAGGRDKNTDLKEFCEEIKKHIKTVVLIGEASERFATNLKDCGFDNIIFKDSMEAAIDEAISLKPKVVLLSPACASFDMFNSFEHRGEVFKNYVLLKK